MYAHNKVGCRREERKRKRSKICMKAKKQDLFELKDNI